jgi:hypothetical protein
MGAYENPAMIVDKSAEILTQGFVQASEAINKGILAMGQGLGERGKAEEKRRQELQDQRTSHYAKVGVDTLKQLQDTAKTLTEKRADDAQYDENVLNFVKENGDQYAEATATLSYPLATKEEKEAASKIVKDFDVKLGGFLTIGTNEGTTKDYFNENKLNPDFVVAGDTEQEKAINQATVDFETGSSNLNVTQEYDAENQRKTLTFTVENTPENRSLYGEDNISETKDGQLQFKKVLPLDDDYSGFLLVKKAGLYDQAIGFVNSDLKTDGKLNSNIFNNTDIVYDSGKTKTSTNVQTFNYTTAEAAINKQVGAAVDALYESPKSSKDYAANMLALKTALVNDFGFDAKTATNLLESEGGPAAITGQIVQQVLAREIPEGAEMIKDDNGNVKYVKKTTSIEHDNPTSLDEFKTTVKSVLNRYDNYKTSGKGENPFADGYKILSNDKKTEFVWDSQAGGFKLKKYFIDRTSGLPRLDTANTTNQVYTDYETMMLAVGEGM